MKYISQLTTALFGLMLWLSPSHSLLAQTPHLSGSTVCGTTPLMPKQALSFIQQASLALQQKRAARRAFSSIVYIPIRPHIMRKSDGSGGFSVANLNKAMALTNSHFLQNGSGIQFYFAGEAPHYIDDDNLFEHFNQNSPIGSYDVTNALNQYYVHVIEEGYSGYAAVPADEPHSTRSVISVENTSHIVNLLGVSTIPHELGHTFGLLHTFGYGVGATLTDELVTRGAGANCETAGDFICDTPADPFNVPGVTLIDVGGCLQYSPASTPRDVNGELFTPSVTNIMSYYLSCLHEFTPGQQDRMQAGLALRQTHTSYTLDFPATNVNTPTNLSISQNALTVSLSWQDNATNEMGYFIERSTSSTTGFVPLSGVAPNVTTFTDSSVAANTRYYYRLRPSNSTTGGLSSTIAISICLEPITLSSSPVRTSALLNWTGTDGQTYLLRWRVAGTTQWKTVNNIPNGNFPITYSLTGLTASTAYEWQVQGVCSTTASSDFTDVQSFTTLACMNPAAYSTSEVGAESVRFFWYNTYEEAGRTAEIRYRMVGTPTWITISSLTSVSFNSSYTLTGLANNTTYEWQIRIVCSPTEGLDYTSSISFTTLCRTPTGLSNTPTATRALLGWSLSSIYDIGTTYDVRYRPVGSADWTTISSIVGGNPSSNYSLTGLTTSTQYEWQVRTACSVNAHSDYSIARQFTTICRTPIANGLGVLAKTSASALLNWSITNDPGNPYDIRYRPVGTTDWATVRATNTTMFGGTYNLTRLSNNTTYEWQIRTVCSPTPTSDFVAGPTFTTQCTIPAYLFTTLQGVTSTIVNWSQTGADVTYDVRYRLAGTTNWTTSSTVASTSLVITGLTGNSGYEWQVRTRCTDGIVTDFSPASTFTTYSCGLPIGLPPSQTTANSVQLNWYFGYLTSETRFDIRYRVLGTTDWIVLTNLQGTAQGGSFILSGLSSATTYEWQIRVLCSSVESSNFTSSAGFQTVASCPVMYTLKTGFWNDPTVWSCNRLPTGSDAVQLKHLITIPASYQAQVMQVNYDAGQQLIVGSGATVRFSR